MQKLKKSIFFVIIIASIVLLILTLFTERLFMPMSFIMIFLFTIPFFIKFERKKIKVEEIILIAVLSAIAAIGRVPFAALPGIQPTSFIIIMSGVIFGSEIGFLIGGIGAIVSNMFLGQGPWTVWQMFSWGMMGYFSGVLRMNMYSYNKGFLILWGILWGFLFGWIMNIWVLAGFSENITLEQVLAVYFSSFYFDILHAFSNAIFIILFSDRWFKILERVKINYGLLTTDK